MAAVCKMSFGFCYHPGIMKTFPQGSFTSSPDRVDILVLTSHPRAENQESASVFSKSGVSVANNVITVLVGFLLWFLRSHQSHTSVERLHTSLYGAHRLVMDYTRRKRGDDSWTLRLSGQTACGVFAASEGFCFLSAIVKITSAL